MTQFRNDAAMMTATDQSHGRNHLRQHGSPLPFRFRRSGILLSAIAAMTVACIGSVKAGDHVPVHVHHGADGESYFAAGLQAPEGTSERVTEHHVLVDTSASQTGRYRTFSLSALNHVLATIRPNDRVAIYAVDVECTLLTGGLVAAASTEVSRAVDQLQARTPLGATDLAAALQTVFSTRDRKSPCSVIYIGDGQSPANLLEMDELAALVDEIQEQHAHVHSLVLGPRTDIQLPAILAHHSGGTVIRTNSESSWSDTGRQIAAAAGLSAVTGQVSVSGSDVSLAGSRRIALRSDRVTWVFGHGSLGTSLKATVDTETAGLLTTEFQASSATVGNDDLRLLEEFSRNSNGLRVTVVGEEMLNDASAEFAEKIDGQQKVARRLERMGEIREAQRIAGHAADMDRDNAGLKAMLTRFDASVNPYSRRLQIADEATRQDGTGNDGFGTTQPGDETALDAARQRSQILTQRLRQEVVSTIDVARRSATEEPDYAISALKDALETIRSAEDVAPEARDELERRVISAIGSVQSERETILTARRAIAERQATEEAQRRMLTEAQLEEERLETRIAQVRGLLERARHGDANAFEDAEAVARIALFAKPGSGTASAALFTSEAAGQLDKVYRLVELRRDRFLETLYQVELSHVPVPDEPPIMYPPADVWRLLTLTRVPRYEAVGLSSEKPAEAWLRRMLDEPVPTLDFPGDVPLSDVLNAISEHFNETHGSEGASSGADFRMTILPDKAELGLSSITSLDQVTVSDINLSGITLRNALELIFAETDNPALTYLIKNEVMLITTIEAAESVENYVTRVYQVGDLVIPLGIQIGGGQFGGGGGGQFGGGGGGQFGGGGGGQFGGGGGGFGGGQGQFSVPPAFVPAGGQNGNAANGFNGAAVDALKKK